MKEDGGKGGRKKVKIKTTKKRRGRSTVRASIDGVE